MFVLGDVMMEIRCCGGKRKRGRKRWRCVFNLIDIFFIDFFLVYVMGWKI